MNRWQQVHRMRGAAFLILIGVLALLHQWGIMRWSHSWPLILIAAGLMTLVERAVWTADVREQQAAESLGVTTKEPFGQSTSANPAVPSYWSPAAPSHTTEPPFIQTHPPAPEDPDREGR
jgi:hypothetical protein